MNITLCNDGEIQFIEGETDIFDVIKNTENKLLKMMQENNVSYKEPVNLNKKNIYRFKESKELGHIEKYFFNFPFKVYKEEFKEVR